jgi:hypothetical protein
MADIGYVKYQNADKNKLWIRMMNQKRFSHSGKAYPQLALDVLSKSDLDL